VNTYEKSLVYKQKIHSLIPGGAHTYSKGDDQFPEISPAAIAYGKGAYVWDLDDNKFLDCTMGLTSISLGHAYEPIIERIKKELDLGVNFSRPSYIEKEMAEKFLDLIPCHDMIKFSKNGSTITTAAVKLARAHTGRKLIAFPGDHPFYSYDDWFIGKTVCDRGVPDEVKSLSVTYKSNDLQSLINLFEMYPNQIAAVISEPEKNNGIPEKYLENAYQIIRKNGAVIIQDEMITGFKTAFPGSISKYNVEPDIATWGKGIANGFSFCAMTGKKEIMNLGGISEEGEEKVFLISTTHGGETHSIAAGMATIDEFQKQDVIGHNHMIGQYFIDKINAVIIKNDLDKFIKVLDCNWLPAVSFKDKTGNDCLGLKTLFLQEMIKRNVLFQGILVPCFSHTKSDIDYLAQAFDESCVIYTQGLESGFHNFLVGKPTKPVFRRYT
jgi:glutamate-1-semialdehyde 2,1-aminomutase